MKNKIVGLIVESGMLTKEQGELVAASNIEKIEHGRLDTYTDAQLAIFAAIGIVEKMGADIELTNTVCDLQVALNRLTAFLIKQQDTVLI